MTEETSTTIFLLCSHVEVVWWASPHETNETYWDQFLFQYRCQSENLITYITNVNANNKYHVLSISKQKTKVFKVTKHTFHDCDIVETWCNAKSLMASFIDFYFHFLANFKDLNFAPYVFYIFIWCEVYEIIHISYVMKPAYVTQTVGLGYLC